MKSYKEFVNESYKDNLLQFLVTPTDKLLIDIPELTNEEVESLAPYGHRTAFSLYSIMNIDLYNNTTTMKDGLMLTMNINEDRYNQIFDIIKNNLSEEDRNHIENFVPPKYATGAKLPPKQEEWNE